MKCRCVQKLRKRLQKEFGNSADLTNTVLTMSGSERFEPARFRFHPKKVNGEKSTRWKTSYVYSDFCQICGKAMNT
jgi:hypothetical protein